MATAPSFTKDELETLYAVFDTIIPAMPVEELVERAPTLGAEVDADTIAAFAEETPSKCSEFRRVVEEVLPVNLPPPKLAELKLVCSLLRSRVAMVPLAGSLTAFHNHPVETREQILLSWKTARLPIYRKLYDSLGKIGTSIYLRSSKVAHKAMMYEPKETAPAPDLYEYTFVSPQDVKHIALDAIIVGSGSGGGVVAKTLSEAGMRVLVIEKGQHWHGAGPAFNEGKALESMYAGSGLSVNDYGDMALISGQVFGGGSTVNWAASLQPPASVRQDWVNSFKLPYFKSPEFQSDLDAVCDYMGVSPPTSQNVQNSLLLEGARRCGFQHAAVPQNNGRGAHGCGHDCANGCRSGGKKGGVHSWLLDAAKAGTFFMTGCDVRTILFSKARAAEGVVVRLANGKEEIINAPRVFVCGGSIESPALLLRSKVPNSRIGKSLYLHPTNYIHAVMPEATHPTEGQILTSVVGELANLSPSGHGVRVETGIMQPGIGMALMQWAGGREHKARIAKHPHMVGMIAIARDRTPGQVVIDNRGEATVHYSVSTFDRNSVVKGTILAAECIHVMGAEEIIVAGRAVKPWKKGDDFEAWKRTVEAVDPGCYGSAHQMGSNRMASSASTGVCAPNGAVFGVSGVYCADASVLPSASGVNPMITTMAVARKIARGVVDDVNGSVKLTAKL